MEQKRRDVTNEIIVEEAETDRSQLVEEKATPRGKVGRSAVLSQITESVVSLKRRKEELKIGGGERREETQRREQESKELMAKVKLRQSRHKESQQQQFSNNLKLKASKLQGGQGDMRAQEEADSEPEPLELEDEKQPIVAAARSEQED